MSAGYQREPLARCHETLYRWCLRLHLPQCVAPWTDVAVGAAAVISVVVVVVTVDVRRLQRRRMSAHGMTNGTQELVSRKRPVVELGQTGLDS